AMLTGMWPLSGGRGTPDQGGLPTPRQARARVPAELSTVTVRALSTTDPDRLTSAAALAEELSPWHREAGRERFVAGPPDPEQHVDTPRRRRRGPIAAVLGGLCAVGLAGLLISAVLQQQGGTAQPTTPATESAGATTATPSPSTPVPVTAVTLYDPPPGDGQEHPAEVGKAADGNSDTVWSTPEYRPSPYFGNLKRGVGLVFDLGQSTSVGPVRIRTTRPGTD